MVVETGSLTQAAERLGIAVSAVSRRLKDLEIRLGAPLIQRTTRRMYLNEVGQGFYDRCKAVLDELEAAQQLHNVGWKRDEVHGGHARERLVEAHEQPATRDVRASFVLAACASFVHAGGAPNAWLCTRPHPALCGFTRRRT